ncbi:MAG: pilus assembly protein PilM [Thermovirgaceae bacterium]|nr:pilus assembly protein PilM [Thermovirgaceae bacterium]
MAIGFIGKRLSAAGLSLATGSIKYLEIEGKAGDLSLARSAEARVEGMAVEQEMIADVQSLESHLLDIKDALGGSWARSVVLGMPSRDVLLRIVEMPPMEIEDAREALKWDFDKYFPFPCAEATFDLGVVATPGDSDRENQKYIVAAARMHVVQSLLDIARKVGISAEAVEPVNVALFRCTRGMIPRPAMGSMVVSVGRNSSQIVVGYEDNGILYRTLLVGGEASSGSGESFAAVAREVSSTFTYLGSQFREMKVEEIVLGGDYAEDQSLKDAIESVASIPVILSDPWSMWGIRGAPEKSTGWESSIGLAVRSLL